MSHYLRVWQACDVQEIGRHLLIVGDVSADCGACKHVGIDYSQVRNCPECGALFRFVASRSASGLGGAHGATVKRIKERRPDLTFIDYGDYRDITGRSQARDFFK